MHWQAAEASSYLPRGPGLTSKGDDALDREGSKVDHNRVPIVLKGNHMVQARREFWVQPVVAYHAWRLLDDPALEQGSIGRSKYHECSGVGRGLVGGSPSAD